MKIDPPSGWLWGFPKKLPEGFSKDPSFNLQAWLIENGLPKEEAKFAERYSRLIFNEDDPDIEYVKKMC